MVVKEIKEYQKDAMLKKLVKCFLINLYSSNRNIFILQQNKQKVSYQKNNNKENQKNKITQNRGVQDFLDRQKKAKELQQEIKYKKKNPYSHIWTVKKGHFSYVK